MLPTTRVPVLRCLVLLLILAAPAADPFGNANGVMGASACGLLGFGLVALAETAGDPEAQARSTAFHTAAVRVVMKRDDCADGVVSIVSPVPRYISRMRPGRRLRRRLRPDLR